MAKTWTAQAEVAAQDDGDWSKTSAVGSREASDWSVGSDVGRSDESDWTQDTFWRDQNLRADRDAWTMNALSPNASGASRVANWSNWDPDSLLLTPEDLDDVTPEEVQADEDEWTIVPEAD